VKHVTLSMHDVVKASSNFSLSGSAFFPEQDATFRSESVDEAALDETEKHLIIPQRHYLGFVYDDDTIPKTSLANKDDEEEEEEEEENEKEEEP
jgi:hypothetical protein